MDAESTTNLERSPESPQDLDQEPTLPGIPRFPDVYRGNKTVVNSRKRPHVKDAPLLLSTSSDPAVFSSDDDPALENVSRHKKRYVGSWFQQLPNSSDSALGEDMPPPPSQVLPKRRRTLRRQFDSGVYMGHVGAPDSSDAELDSGSSVDHDRPDARTIVVPKQLDIIDSDGLHGDESEEEPVTYIRVRGPCRPNPHSDACYRRLAIERATPKYGAVEPEIQDYFRTLIEHGEEAVDISNIGMQSISNATISLLSGLVRIPTVIEDVDFEQPETSINLIMSNNLLTRVPTSVFRLEHLTTLSLRGNNLVELPPSISKCKSLRSLNVSFNQLRYLPGEILDLLEDGGSLQELQVFGNPFYQRTEAPPELDETEEGDTNERAHFKTYRTPVQYTDTAGTIYSDFKLDDREEVELEPAWELAAPKRPRSLLAHPPSRAPSLLELALLSASRASRNDASLAPLLGADAPDHLRALLDGAADARYQGLPQCCVCGRAFVRARTRWLEFLAREEEGSSSGGGGAGPLVQVRIIGAPFLRRGCSWRCVPEIVPREGGADEEET